MRSFTFSSSIQIKSAAVFYCTRHTFGFVNLKPFVPGHVLLAPIRVVERFRDLSDEEAADLAVAAKRVCIALEQKFHAEAVTFAIQDGEAAGQTVRHVHLHIVPRARGDWANNDDIYRDLQGGQRAGVDAENRRPRTQEEMFAEAREMRGFIPAEYWPDDVER